MAAISRAPRLADTVPAERDDEMMRLVAELYYLRDHSQPAIATLTGFSVSKVSRLLAQARETGIVRITVDQGRTYLDAEGARLAKALGLRHVHLTPARSDSPALAPRLCAAAAAAWLTNQIPKTGVLGLADGYSVAAAVEAFAPDEARTGLTVVPLVGGYDPTSPSLDANEIVRRAAERLQANYRLLHAPAMFDSADVKRALLEERGIRMTTEQWEHLGMALVAVGSGPQADAGYRTIMDRLMPAERQRLAARHVVGDFVGHVFTFAGEFLDDDVTERTIAAPIEVLRRTPHVVAIAAGPHKVDSIIGAARSGVLHALVTDELTAEGVFARLEGADA